MHPAKPRLSFPRTRRKRTACTEKLQQKRAFLSTALFTAEIDEQLPEYVKQALEHETYSKVHGIRALTSRLANSLSAACLALEEARIRLLRGDGLSEESSMAALLKIVRQGSLVDNRNYEYVPEIGGKMASMREMTEVGGMISETWVKSYARVLLQSGEFVKGSTVGEVIDLDGSSVRRFPHVLPSGLIDV